MTDPYHLERFVAAQQSCYECVCEELRQGEKRTHWMWFIFPQVAGLGSSSTSKFYAIQNLDEARAYLAHPILGPRLIECATAALQISSGSATDVFGSPDDQKLRSSATLFAAASAPGSVFERLLDKYFQGQRDERTLERLQH